MARRKKRKARKGPKTHIPLNVLQKRYSRLGRILKHRGGLV